MSAPLCAWCNEPIPNWRPGARFCSTPHRQAAHRLTKLGHGARATSQTSAPLAWAYADPPYPGTAAKYYRGEANFSGEVDHRALIDGLELQRGVGLLDGWALSTSEDALREVLPICPPGTRTCPWVKPIGVSPATYGPHNTWEALLVVGGRRIQGVRERDWLRAMPARRGGELPGRKPIAFCAFLFAQLGMLPGDTLDDLFPGSGIITAAWLEMSRRMSLERSDGVAET